MNAQFKMGVSGLEFYSDYDPDLVAELKAIIPASERRWEPGKKCWIVSPAGAKTLRGALGRMFGINPPIPQINPGKRQISAFEVVYIGAVKDRGGEQTAMGATTRLIGSIASPNHLPMGSVEWNIVFPLAVLEKWFWGRESELKTQTLYTILNVKQSATLQEIKRGFRKQAKRFHPDINRDGDAAEMMQQINYAWEVLGNPLQRRKYDAGLKLQASTHSQPTRRGGFQLPLRSGNIMVAGREVVGRFVVEEIQHWQDIKRGNFSLVSSWDRNLDAIQIDWI
jgi:hypothetical protein